MTPELGHHPLMAAPEAGSRLVRKHSWTRHLMSSTALQTLPKVFGSEIFLVAPAQLLLRLEVVLNASAISAKLAGRTMARRPIAASHHAPSAQPKRNPAIAGQVRLAR